MLIGVLAGLAAGALWGLTFVAPLAVAPFTIIDFTVGRYVVFGLVSVALMALDRRFRPARGGLSASALWTGLALGTLGYVCYFVATAYAVVLAGPAIPPLVIGLLPVVLAVIGNWNDRSAPWHRLAVPLLLIVVGTGMVNVHTLLDSPDGLSHGSVWLGTLVAVAALAIWVVYGVLNSRVMRSASAPGPLPWTGLQGIGAALGALPLLPWSAAFTGSAPVALADPAGLNFLFWVLLLAIPGSWIATWLWVVAAHRLSLALSAQLVVTESVFGLLYGFAWIGRWPSLAEALGAALQMGGVILAVRLFASLHRPMTDAEIDHDIAPAGSGLDLSPLNGPPTGSPR
jgi:drug/metabolite transporter (DMT)-like permease